MIIITGASDGIGKYLAKLYKESGRKVINISRRPCEYADTNICLSLREGPEIKKATDQIKELLSSGEVLESIINCIGIWTEEHFGDITENEVKRTMSTNLKAPMLFVSNLFDEIKKHEADILNVISTAGITGRAEFPLYSASKWAERGYTKSLQEALKNTKSRVISFCPGGMNTGFFEKAGTDLDTKEWMQPEDIAAFMKQILDLPKSIEVSEVILNRK
jgi:short-subunit dehydrogenase